MSALQEPRWRDECLIPTAELQRRHITAERAVRINGVKSGDPSASPLAFRFDPLDHRLLSRERPTTFRCQVQIHASSPSSRRRSSPVQAASTFRFHGCIDLRLRIVAERLVRLIGWFSETASEYVGENRQRSMRHGSPPPFDARHDGRTLWIRQAQRPDANEAEPSGSRHRDQLRQGMEA